MFPNTPQSHLLIIAIISEVMSCKTFQILQYIPFMLFFDNGIEVKEKMLQFAVLLSGGDDFAFPYQILGTLWSASGAAVHDHLLPNIC